MTTLTDRAVISRADDNDYQPLTMLLVAAFFNGDLAGHLIPDPAERASCYFPYFEIITEHALNYASIDLISTDDTDDTGGPAAAAIWYRLDAGQNLTDLPDYDQRLAAAVGAALPRFAALDRSMHAHHPTDRDHDYLAYLAVRPGQQSTGLGSRLLRHHHQSLDVISRVAYLEATGERNRRLYARHGYTALEPFPVADAGPPLYPMWRLGQES